MTYVIFEELSEVEQRAMKSCGFGTGVRRVSRGSEIFLWLDRQKRSLQRG